MAKKWIWGITIMALLLVSLPVLAQESAVAGNISGVIQDSTGAVLPGAKVVLTGPTGSKTATSENDGKFVFPVLTLGTYSVRVEKQGFRAAELKGVEVVAGKTSAITITMQPGSISEVVEVSGTAVTVDTSSAAVGADLPDTFYQQVPVARNVAGLFYVAPGAVSGGGTGQANPSISGASGLENLYVADGVNITDPSYGGLGVYTASYGSVGTGINLSFIKEVNVKTSGFEPQYGQASGGIVQLITKSGGTKFTGELGAYLAPQQFEATRLQSDDVRTNKAGDYLHQGNFDFDGELGGYIPGFKNHIFFFGSFNPAYNQQFVEAPPTAGLFALGVMKLQADVYNYDGKLTFKLNDNHQIEASVFGDPSHNTTGPEGLVLNSPNDTGFDNWRYGSRNVVVRYNGTLSPTWLVNGSFSWNHAEFNDNPKYDVFGITDRTNASNIHALQGFGYIEDHNSDTYSLNVDTQKIGHFGGEHTLSLGYQYQAPDYNDFKTASGDRFAFPSTNMVGGPITACTGGDSCPLGNTTFIWSGSLRASPGCTVCPTYNGTPVYVSFSRGQFNNSTIPTSGRYHAAFANDNWAMGKHVTLDAGIRWEQWHMAGTGSQYTFTDNWAPRIGFIVDPWGDRKTKISAHFARYNYQTPLDAAVRSLSGELDDIGLDFAPASTGGVVNVNPNGSINLVTDAAHVLNNVPGAVSASGAQLGNVSVGGSAFGEAFGPGTKMMYSDEYTVGFDHEFKNGLVVSGRFIYRNLPRVLDDVSGVSPEGYVYGVQTQNYFIANPSPKLDLFPNPNEVLYTPLSTDPTSPMYGAPPASLNCPGYVSPAKPGNAEYPVVDVNGGTAFPNGTPYSTQGICYQPDTLGYFGGEVGANGQPVPDGVPDGFPLPVHHYKAVEIEVNKSFSNNWMLRANWRIASLTGNYEGAFRNDNGQSDPNISSLFDFTNGILGMLGQQYQPGPLNTDRRHVVNVYTSYVFSKTFLKSLELGTGVNIQSGTPVSQFGNHPAYGNSGEIPIGGRGVLGRTPVSGNVNLHLNRPFKVTERSTLNLTADLFNLSDSRPITLYDQNLQISGSSLGNVDFDKVQRWDYQRPFYARFSVRWVF